MGDGLTVFLDVAWGLRAESVGRSRFFCLLSSLKRVLPSEHDVDFVSERAGCMVPAFMGIGHLHG
jgi:hypothetical protein